MGYTGDSTNLRLRAAQDTRGGPVGRTDSIEKYQREGACRSFLAFVYSPPYSLKATTYRYPGKVRSQTNAGASI